MGKGASNARSGTGLRCSKIRENKCNIELHGLGGEPVGSGINGGTIGELKCCELFANCARKKVGTWAGHLVKVKRGIKRSSGSQVDGGKSPL